MFGIFYVFDESYIQRTQCGKGRGAQWEVSADMEEEREILVNPKGKRELQKPAPHPVFSKWQFSLLLCKHTIWQQMGNRNVGKTKGRKPDQERYRIHLGVYHTAGLLAM